MTTPRTLTQAVSPSFAQRTILVTALLGACAASAPAWAQEEGRPAEAPAVAASAAPAAEEPKNTLAFNVGLASDYRYRGISQSRLKPALSGGVDFTHTSGFYVGTWVSTIKWVKDAGGNAPAEWDVYGGYKSAIGDTGLSYDVGVLRYNYPDHSLPISPGTTEIYGALTYSVVTLKYSHAVTNLFGFADSKNSGYLDASATFDLGNGFSLVPHLGRQWVRHNSPYSYTDWALTLNKDFGNGLSASAAVIGTNADKALYVTPGGRFTGRTALVLGVKYTF